MTTQNNIHQQHVLDVLYLCPLDLHGATENAGLKNAGPSKMQGWKTRDWKTRDQMTGVENAGLENAGPFYRGWKT